MGHCWGLYGFRVLELLWESWRLFLTFYAILEVYTWFQKFLLGRCQLSYNPLGIFVTTSFYKFFAVKLIITFCILHNILVKWKSGFSDDSCICKYFPWQHSEFEYLCTIVTIKLSTTKFERPYLYWKSLIEFQRYNNVH